ncbi:MAG: hypothetical protein IKC67_01150 [Odoribacter sp.]|nr:hypothetical protein [Bacteroidales bacterium]MBR2980713.1 hypothetical protein [Odoribacter sp.]
MRKIASNYLLTSELNILKRSYWLVDNNAVVCGYGILSNDAPEEHGVEFYGGMVIAGRVDLGAANIGESIGDYIARIGHFNDKSHRGVSLITALNWDSMSIEEGTTVSYIT